MTRNDELFDRAQASIPGGVNSPVRAFRSVGGTPRFLDVGEGRLRHRCRRPRVRRPRRELGPGHPRPRASRGRRGRAGCRGPRPLVRRLDPGRDRTRRARAGARHRGGASPIEKVRLRLDRHRGDDDGHPAGPRIHRSRPAGQVRRPLPRSLRLAAGRGRLGLATLAPARLRRRAPPPRPRRPSCCPTTTSTRCARLRRAPGRIAAVITEAAAANMGVVAPDAGFNARPVGHRPRQRRAAHHRRGAHRVPRRTRRAGGRSRTRPRRADGRRDAVQPRPRAPSARSSAAGCPLAALGGRADVMDYLAPARPGLPGGHAVGEPGRRRRGHRHPAARRRAVYAHLDATAELLAQPCRRRSPTRASRTRVQRAGNLFSFVFGDYRRRRGARAPTPRCSGRRRSATRPFFHAMLDAGVSLPPSVFEAWFVSAAHDDVAIGRILDALPGGGPRSGIRVAHAGGLVSRQRFQKPENVMRSFGSRGTQVAATAGRERALADDETVAERVDRDAAGQLGEGSGPGGVRVVADDPQHVHPSRLRARGGRPRSAPPG